jgi:Flp pilus assembly pilin Flp
VLPTIVRLETALMAWLDRLDDERGQTTAEYALVLLGAAAVALMVIAWATKTKKVTQFLDAVFDKLLSQVS